MKTNYAPLINRSQNSRRKGGFPLPIKIVIAIIFILGLAYAFLPNLFSSVFLTLARPFWNVEQNVRYGDSFVNVSALVKENDDLKQKISADEAGALQFDLLQKENEQLKAMMGRAGALHITLAAILKKPPFSAYDTFILDIGKDKGVETGQKVYALGDIPIGEIAEVSANTSKVKLYSSAGEKYTVFIGDAHIQATALGKGGGTFEASVPRDAKISAGDNVTIPSLNNSFLGKVGDIISEPSHPFAAVLFSQPFNLYELRFVEVETPVPDIKN